MATMVAEDAIAAAEIGLFKRLTDDAELKTYTGAGERIFDGWPPDTLEEADFPRVTTLYVVATLPAGKDGARVRFQVNPWAWVGPKNAGRARLFRMSGRIIELFEETSWVQDGYGLYARIQSIAGGPAGGVGPRTRRHDIIIEANRR